MMELSSRISLNSAKIALRSRTKAIIYTFLGTLIAATLLYAVSSRWSFAYATQSQSCLPWDYFIIEKTERPSKDGLIAFYNKSTPYYPDGLKWVKFLKGTEGDQIVTVSISPIERALNPSKYVENVYVHDMPVPINIQGFVYLYRKGEAQPLAFRVLEKTTTYKNVPMIESQIIPHGKYFVAGTTPRSYDSRYWGLVDESSVIGKSIAIR